MWSYIFKIATKTELIIFTTCDGYRPTEVRSVQYGYLNLSIINLLVIIIVTSDVDIDLR